MIENLDLAARATPPEWFVAFYSLPNAPRAWWERRGPFGFRHTLAFGYSAYSSCWLVYDVTQNRTYVYAVLSEDIGAFIAALPSNRTVLKLPVADTPRRGWRWGFWCTRGVAHLLGVPSRALRPIALYRELLARGAVPAFTEPAR